ncbi:hypothetical protein [Limnobaculum xujianqingii]|uniref:hypothetical protein n=1 Tax=Limnobaculum xujianqingii TaxID=2738837 RepID=UPI001129A833|nr:hypothetical protein [Limnobaculum xujianqingii]
MKSRNTNAVGCAHSEPTNWYFYREGYSKFYRLPVLLSQSPEEAIMCALKIYTPDLGERCYLGKPTYGHSYLGVIDAVDIVTTLRKRLDGLLSVGDASDECDLKLSQQAELECLLANWLDEHCPLQGLFFEETISFRVTSPDSANAMTWEILPL